MKEEENLDSLARQLLFNTETEPSEAVWARLEAQLPASKKRISPILFTKKIGFAVLFMAVGAGGWWYWGSGHPANTRPIQQPVVSQGKSEKSIFEEEMNKGKTPSESKANSSKSQGLPAVDLTDKNMEPNQNGAGSFNQVHSAYGHEIAGSQELDEAKSMQVKKIASLRIVDQPQSERSSYQNRTAVPETQSLSTPSDPFRTDLQFMAAKSTRSNIGNPNFISDGPKFEYGSLPRSGWVVGAFADLRLTSLKIRQSTESSAVLVDSILSKENVSTNYGLGISFGYHINESWRISSGVALAKWCRVTSYPVKFDLPEAFVGVATNIGDPVPLEQEIFSATGIQTVNWNATAGDFVSASELNTLNEELNETLNIEECYELLRVPIQIEYRFRTKRIGILPGAGLAYDRVISRTTKLVNSNIPDTEIALRNQENARQNFVSFTASLHLEYQLSQKWAMRAGASYQEWITPVYQSDQIKTYPRLVSVDTGLIYIFSR